MLYLIISESVSNGVLISQAENFNRAMGRKETKKNFNGQLKREEKSEKRNWRDKDKKPEKKSLLMTLFWDLQTT